MPKSKRDWDEPTPTMAQMPVQKMVELVIAIASGIHEPETQWELDAFYAAVEAGFVKPPTIH